jgi:hypothetical protein
MHGVLHKTMHHKTQLILGEIGSDLGQLHDVSFSLNCQWELSHERVSDKKTSLGYFLLRNTTYSVYGCFPRKKMPFEYCFLETNIL